MGRGTYVAKVLDLLLSCGADDAHVHVAARAHVVEDACHIGGRADSVWSVRESSELKERDTYRITSNAPEVMASCRRATPSWMVMLGLCSARIGVYV